MNPTRDNSSSTTPGWRLAATNLDAPLRQRLGELLLDDGHVVHRAPSGHADAVTTGSVRLADLVSITAAIRVGGGPDDCQVVELSSSEHQLRIAAPVDLVLVALRASHAPQFIRATATTEAGR